MSVSRRAALAMLGPLALGCPASTYAQGAQAQGFPRGPIRVVVPFVPGGTSDLVARQLAVALQDDFGQPVIVDNRPGAGTILGTELVARSAPDGQTVLLIANSFLINGSLHRSLPYDPLRDFAPVAQLTVIPHVLVARPGIADSFEGFLAAARRSDFTFGSYGNGTSNHLGAEQFRLAAGFRATHVPYRGGGQAYTDLTAGRIDFMFANLPDVLQPVANGTWRALAIVAPERSLKLPQVPTLAEKGFNLTLSDSWFGIVIPAATPAAIRARHSEAWLTALRRPEIRTRLEEQGYTVLARGAEEFGQEMRRNYTIYADVVRASGATAD